MTDVKSNSVFEHLMVVDLPQDKLQEMTAIRNYDHKLIFLGVRGICNLN